MIPIEQTTIGDNGNCLAACIASILEVPLEQVPSPGERPVMLDDGLWLEYAMELKQWLNSRGISYIVVGWSQEIEFPDGYVIASVCYPKSQTLHAVVVLDGKLVWDPKPIVKCDGLDGMNIWDYTILYPLDPARLIRNGT